MKRGRTGSYESGFFSVFYLNEGILCKFTWRVLAQNIHSKLDTNTTQSTIIFLCKGGENVNPYLIYGIWFFFCFWVAFLLSAVMFRPIARTESHWINLANKVTWYWLYITNSFKGLFLLLLPFLVIYTHTHTHTVYFCVDFGSKMIWQ